MVKEYIFVVKKLTTFLIIQKTSKTYYKKIFLQFKVTERKKERETERDR